LHVQLSDRWNHVHRARDPPADPILSRARRQAADRAAGALRARLYGFVLQTHRHTRPAPAAYAGAPAHALALDADDVCDLCTAVAAQDPFLPPHPTLLILSSAFPAPAPIDRAAYPLLLARAHIWRSRAPPDPAPLP